MKRRWWILIPLAVAISLSGMAGCSDLGYYLQCAQGQMELMSKRRPIPQVLADPATPADLHQSLETALEIRDFASRNLGLPDNDSYRSYVDLGRPYVVWNVVATPEFSLQPVTWCFPIAGCVPYRGYYHQERAEAFAADLRQQGYDTWVYGVPAYSTLNWFSDPLLSTFNHRPETVLAGLIFHELAHQLIYLPGASDFNEAFAETVEQEGVLRWLTSRGQAGRVQSYLASRQRQEDFVALAMRTRARLADLYRQTMPVEKMRQDKAAILEAFRQELRAYRDSHNGFSGYDPWLTAELNNSRFASLSTYRQLVPAFQSLLRLKQGDLSAFYTEVRRIAGLDDQERTRVLAYLGTVLTAGHPENPKTF